MDIEYYTPFDDVGKCHHHPDVQMATKKSSGEWKILLMQGCPKCIEAKYEEESIASGASGSRSCRDRNSGHGGSPSSVVFQRLELEGGGGHRSAWDASVNFCASVSSSVSHSTKRSVASRTAAVTCRKIKDKGLML